MKEPSMLKIVLQTIRGVLASIGAAVILIAVGISSSFVVAILAVCIGVVLTLLKLTHEWPK